MVHADFGLFDLLIESIFVKGVVLSGDWEQGLSLAEV